MHASRGSLILIGLLLAGCGTVSSVSRPYTEPADGATAKVRVVTNGAVRFIPNRACTDFDAPGTGLVASAEKYIGKSPTHNGQQLGIKGELKKDPDARQDDNVTAEVLVRANEPLTMVFRSDIHDGDWKFWCEPMTVAFIPEAGEEYEVLGQLGDKYCKFFARSLTHPDNFPVQKRTGECKAPAAK